MGREEMKELALYNMRFEVLSAVKMFSVVFWIVVPCEFVGGYQPFSPEYGRCFSAILVPTYKSTWCHNPENHPGQ
jgi:hypothetical protein